MTPEITQSIAWALMLVATLFFLWNIADRWLDARAQRNDRARVRLRPLDPAMEGRPGRHTTKRFRDLYPDIESGNEDALIQAVAMLAAEWLWKAGHYAHLRHVLKHSSCVSDGSAKDGFVAAAMDLYVILEMSPKGRELLTQLHGQKILQQPKGE